MPTQEPDDKPKPSAKGAREARLAQALRDNLRRRKAAPQAASPKAED